MAVERVAFDLIEQFGNLSHFGIVILDADQKTIYINPAIKNFLAITGKDQPVDFLTELYERIVPGDRKHIESLMSKLSAGNLSQIGEIRVHSNEGQQLLLRCSMYFISGGMFQMWIVENLTEARQHERYLVEYGSKKNTLLDTVSHQLYGSLQLMQHLISAAKQLTAKKGVLNYLEALQRNNKHCVAIINDLLKEEHVRSPDVVVKRTRGDVLEIILFVIQELKKTFPERQFNFVSPPGPVYIDTDEVKFLQVVNNLASNAVKFTPPEKPVSFIVKRGEDAIVIEVRDEGIGIPETLRPYIFDRFTRAGRVGLHGERSFGLGLSICKRLVGLMDGVLWADSEEGKGSSFYIMLPFKE